MKRFLSLSVLVGMVVSMSAFAEETPVQYAFSGATANENKVTVQGAGFGAYPQASVTFGYIPTDNAFDGATDGQGATITAKPGEGVMIFGQPIASNFAAMIRCSVRVENASAAVTLATIGDKPDQFVATNSPANESYFTGQYQRIAVFCTPPSTGFQPVIQIVNISKTETLTAYVDQLEIYSLDPGKYYSAAFLDNDSVDPPSDQISIPLDSNSGVFPPSYLTIVYNGQVVFLFTPCSAGSVPGHVSVDHTFYMGAFEVTQAQWKGVMGNDNNPSEIKGDSLPVTNVSIEDCQTFIATMNAKNIGTFRLPTIQEWEYACRAGTSTTYYWGNDTAIKTPDPYYNGGLLPDAVNIPKYAWYYFNSDRVPHPVATKTPNQWNLYDMSGNVEEWSSTSDSGGEYCLCGGSIYDFPANCSSTPNSWVKPPFRNRSVGFRLLMEFSE